MKSPNTRNVRLYLTEDHTAAIDRISALTDNPSLTRILSTVLRLIEDDPVLAERILREINSNHVDQQIKQWFSKGDSDE